MSHAYDIALDQEGNKYVLEHNHVKVFDSSGTFLKTIGEVTEDYPGYMNAIDVDRQGNVYLLNFSYSYVKILNPSGASIAKFDVKPSGQTAHVSGIAVDSEGNSFVHYNEVNLIQKFNKNGVLLRSFTTGVPLRRITITPNDILLASSTADQIMKYSLDGILLGTIKISLPHNTSTKNYGDLGVDSSGNLYVIEEYSKKIERLSEGGQYLSTVGATISNGTKNLAISAQGEIHVAENYIDQNGLVQIFTSSGELRQTIGNTKRYKSITQDSFGNYYLLQTSPAVAIEKYNSYGKLLLKFEYTGIESGFQWLPIGIQADAMGNVFLFESNTTNRARIKQFSSAGKLMKTLMEFPPTPTNGIYKFAQFHLDFQGNFYVLNAQFGHAVKINPKGEIIGYPGGGRTFYSPSALTTDKAGNLYVVDYNNYRIHKYSSTNAVLDVFDLKGPEGSYPRNFNLPLASIQVDHFGNIYLWSGEGSVIRVINPKGQQISSIPSSSGLLSFNRTGNKLLVLNFSYVTEHLSAGTPIESAITGKIFQDSNLNCKVNTGEKPLPGIIVKAEPGPYYGISDENGEYVIPVKSGSYTVSALIPPSVTGKQIIPTCSPTGPIINVEKDGILVMGPDFGYHVTLSPILNVSLSSNRRRRCMENLTTVSYSNTGFAPAANAKVHVQFPAEVIFKSASFPFTRDARGNYVFEVGTLQPGQRGTISISDSVSCADPTIRGLTVCTKAWITPTNTYPESPVWDKADIALSAAESAGDQARFVLLNKGQGSMKDSLSFRIYEDQELLTTGKYQLASGDSTVLRVPTTGRVLRMEAEQPEGHPIKTMASANLEIRSRNTSGLPDVAMMALPPDDPEPEFVEECLPIVDSYDPNDKQVVPVGLTSEFYTPTNTPLRYTVRFQNTGTDVAYRVVVVDTLSADLDMATFQVGAVSHPYVLSVSGKEKPVLTFTFNNIMLPDSAADQAGSNGFIQFSVRPKADLPEKHLIENLADIFFDYNEPVRTNTIQNRIYDMPPVLSDRQLSARDVVVSPSIEAFSPAQGRIGTLVTISGRNFSPTASGNKVYFNGTQAQITAATATELKALVPFGATTGKVKIVTSDGTASAAEVFTVFQVPTISSLSSWEGTPGATITITGTHFSSVIAEDTVYFNGVEARVLEASETQLKVEVPATAYKGKILIKTLGGQVESAQEFMVWHHPVVADFSPNAAKVGVEVTITGSKFAEGADKNQVFFHTTQAQVIEASPTLLRVVVPTGATTGPVKVITENGQGTSPTNFIIYQPPVITSFSPTEGIIGSEVTLQGSFLTQELVKQVLLGELICPIIRFGTNSVTVTIPHNATTGKFTILSKGGEAVSHTAFKVWYTPSISGFNVPRQRVGGLVILLGDNFAAENNRNVVQFGDKPAEVLASTGNSILVKVPAVAVSGMVTATTPGGSASKFFEIIPAPIITAVQPARASVGSVVDLKGDNFLAIGEQDTVWFGEAKALVLNASNTTIQVRVPRGAVTGQVTVAGLGGRAHANFTVEELTADQAIQVYPNPSTGKFTVDFIKADFDVQAVQVFEITGKLLHTQNITAGQTESVEVNLNHAPPGMFLLVIHTSRGKVIKRISII